MSPSTVGLCLLLLVLAKLLHVVYTYFSSAQKARQMGCKPAPALPQPWWDYFGIRLVQSTIAAAKQGKFLDALIDRQQLVRNINGSHVGTFTITTSGEKVIFTSEPKNVQAVLATQFKDFGIPDQRVGAWTPLLLGGIFLTNGHKWEHSRAMLRPSFVKDRVGNLEMEKRHVAHLIEAIPVGADGWSQPVDLSPMFFRLTIDSSSEFLFGESVNSQLLALKHTTGREDINVKSWSDDDFAAAFDAGQEGLVMRTRMGNNYWMYRNKDFDKAVKICHEFIDHYVNLALNKAPVDKKETSKADYLFIDELVRQTRDPVELKSQLISILMAGRDTSAGLLGFLFALLAKNPTVYKKLREAILQEFGDENAKDTIDFSTLKGCKYLQHCLNETLRLFPVIPLNGRMALRDTSIPFGGGEDGQSPVFVKKGESVQYSVYVMHREPKFWGPDVNVFRPERWEEIRGTNFNYLPFNAGPRVCIGQQFALTSAAFTTVNLLQRFDAIEDLNPAEILQAILLTTKPAKGVNVRLHRAQPV